jgi:HNH endonuclease/AP2 domain
MSLSQEELKSAFEYEPLTGIVRWKENRSNMVQGSIAGCTHGSGYKVVTINSKSYKLHRVIWIMLFNQIPDGFYIDHINGNKIDNRLENLRLATNSQNQQNRPAPKNSSSGYRGVTWHKQVNKWMARICHNQKRITIGFFDTAEQAYEAYKAEAKKLYSHANRLP